MVAYLPFAAFAAAADLAGAVLVVTAHRKGLAPLRYFVAAGAGFMLAAAFVRMLPESAHVPHAFLFVLVGYFGVHLLDRKSTRLNSSHQIISYAVFCLKKKKK